MTRKKVIGLVVVSCMGLVGMILTGCTGFQSVVSKYETDVRNACLVFEAAANSPLGDLASSIPVVGSAISLGKSGCDTESAIQTLIGSPTSVAWIGTLVTTIQSKGTVVPPAPVDPTTSISISTSTITTTK